MTTTTKRFTVAFRMSYTGQHDSNGWPIKKIGTGEAGWTVADFGDRCEAQAFADALPLCSRMPNHGVGDRMAKPHYLTDAELRALA